MNLSLFLGVIFGSIGSFAILQTLHKKEVIKLKRYFSNQQETYTEELQQKAESYDQLINDQEACYIAEIHQLEQHLKQQTKAKEELARQLKQVQSHEELVSGQQENQTAEIQSLQLQLHQEIAEKENILLQLEKEKEKTQARQRELRKSNKDIDEILEALEQDQKIILENKDLEILTLQEQNRDLAINLEQLKVELFTLKQNRQSNASGSGNAEDSGWTTDQITELLKSLFPDIVLLRDSIAILTSQPENLVKLITAIKDIYDGHPYSPTKVRATDKKWTECRVPHINLMRIYFQKCKKESGYQILISPKKNQKSQDQDYEWLKGHQAC
ncbi:hypothetical protein Lepto7376_3105 [[Leptolyngbya] sp. PCC 7376]|uniref:hypothetical protein n=1 Tax=[Leptolyngbya] sp. PCC 7376 TaxID=111781 RepID=UPI00029EE72F|nr:hypothetical protein [[Leptolyngbya] sp. PCC 7376]AFY39342.1 hypothetical protein Lepto7376_3105 [[Leptolyngbya] sp. PCC 7376]